MNDPLRLAGFLPQVLTSVADTDLSLMEQSAVFRLAAEACQQAHVIAEVTLLVQKGRNRP